MGMNNRFNTPHWSQSTMPSRYNINNGGIPIHSTQPSAQNQMPEARAAARKVVQIPVRFLDSEPSRRRPDSALKIQKVCRGFLIRRSVKKIMQLKREVDEIAQMISRSDVVESIRKDQREKLRINEMLMALLFKLDLIRGFDAGVRDCRKAVVKKVISLQDKVDDIVSSKTDQIQSESYVELEKHESNEEVFDPASCNFEDGSDLPIKEPDFDLLCPFGGDLEMKESEEKSAMDESGGICEGDGEIDLSGQNSKEEFFEDGSELPVKESDPESCPVGWDLEEKSAMDESGGVCGIENSELKKENSFETSKDEFVDAVESIEEINAGKETEEILLGEEKNLEDENGGEKKESGAENNNEQVMKKLMEDNEKMMNMMTQLFERNEMQTQMLNTLKNKVELLEKAFVCSDRTRRKKMKKRHSS